MAISSTPTTSFNGVVSGLNTSSIIQAMMSLDQAPLTQLQNQQSTIQSRDSAYQAVQKQVQSFQGALQTLLTASNVDAKTVGSSTSGIATATANATAVNNAYTLNVTRLATATSVTSSHPITTGVDDGSTDGTLLTNAGFSITPTAGTFTVNGVQITATSSDTLSSLLQKITDSSAGGSGAGTGVVASLVNDANGNPNYIKLTPVPGNTNPIQLGAAGDTSNFLTAADLVATGISGGGSAGAVQSGQPLSTTATSAALTNVKFQTGALASSGTLTINGTAINWSNTDSLSTVLNRINSSSAGVRAAFDPLSDSVSFTNLKTGNQAVSLSETTSGSGSGLLHALGVDGAQQYGQTAAYTVSQNGVTGATQYSNSNSITVAPGVSATLQGTGSTVLTVAQDTTTAVNNVNGFITQYNQLVDLLDKDTAYNSGTKSGGVLLGDPTIQSLESQLKAMVAAPVAGVSGQYNSLASIGISTGAPGAAVGSTNHLQLNTTTLTSALQNNPDGVLAVLTGNRTATVNPDRNGVAQPGSWISSVGGTPFGANYGTYQLTVDSSGNVTSVYTATGAKPLSAQTGTITAGGTNSTLVPGITFTAGALPPPGGTYTDRIFVGQTGVLGSLDNFLTGVLGTTGLFATEHNNSGTELSDISTQITDMNARLAQEQKSLQTQFSSMESTLATLQGQSSSLASALGGSSSASLTSMLGASGG